MDFEILRSCLKKLGKEEWVENLETLEKNVNKELGGIQGKQKMITGKVETWTLHSEELYLLSY